MTDPYRPNDIEPPAENEKTPWPGTGPEVTAGTMLAGEMFYRQDENDRAPYTKLFLGATAERNGREQGFYYVNADVLHGAEGEFFADHITSDEMVRKVWTGRS